MKLIKRILLALGLMFLISVITLLVTAVVYEKEVKEYMNRQLNNNLRAKVIINPNDISFSLIKNFPYASLNFKRVVMLESFGNASSNHHDTLFAADNVALKFSIWNLFSKDFSVKKVAVTNGKVKLKVSKDGFANWNFWKTSETHVEKRDSESAFNIESFNFENIALSYRNYKNPTDIACLINGGRIAGNFRSKQYELSVLGNVFVDRFYIDSINYVDDSPVQLDLNLFVDNDKNRYKFSDAHLSVSNQKVNVQGEYIDNSPPYIDISLSGEEMNIQSVLSLLPDKYYKYVQDYESDGEFYCKLTIKGNWSKSASPQTTAEFGIKNADITQLSSGIILKNVNVSGSYKNENDDNVLQLKTFSASLANGRIAGDFTLKNFSSPFLKAKMNATLLLEDVRQLLKVDTLWNYPLVSLSGILKADIEYEGNVNTSGKYTKMDFDNVRMSGSLLFENAGLKIKNSSLAFDSINGLLVLNGNAIDVNYIKGKTLKSDFYMKGNIKNIIGYTFNDNSNVFVDAMFESNNLDLDELLINQAASTKRDTVYKLRFSKNLNFNLSSNVGHLTFRRFEAEKIRGTFQLRDQKLIADPISFYTMDGSVTATGMIDGTQNDAILISCDANINKLNISKLFFQFEDFNQSTLTHKNIRGKGTASIQFASVMKPDLSIDPKRIYTRSELTLEGGELINFEPLKALSKYISLSELEDIKFSNLKNNIEIKDQKIFIPKMDIHSSALDVTISGTHAFDNSIDYHFKVLMSDVLFKKAKRAKKENDEFGVVENDKDGKTSLFISMTGTVDKPIIRYDKKEAKQNLKENIASEKQSMKKILKDEFGWFKKDTVLNKKVKEKKEDGKFIIKWDEDEKEDSKSKDDDEDF